MKAINKINKWANAKTNIAFDVLRVGLGIFFFIKGIQFADQTQMLLDLVQPKDSNGVGLLIVHYVAMVHFAGGLLIAFGLLTRLSCLLQLPIVIGAVIVNFTIAMNPESLIQALLALVLTSFFVVYGSGRHSVDYAMKLHL